MYFFVLIFCLHAGPWQTYKGLQPGLVGGKPYSVCECGKTYKRLQQRFLREGNLIAFVSVWQNL